MSKQVAILEVTEDLQRNLSNGRKLSQRAVISDQVFHGESADNADDLFRLKWRFRHEDSQQEIKVMNGNENNAFDKFLFRRVYNKKLKQCFEL